MESGNPCVNNDQRKDSEESEDEIQQLLPLFRLLMREPPEGHDFATCPICKRHDITSLEA
jgi:hypothetical protein